VCPGRVLCPPIPRFGCSSEGTRKRAAALASEIGAWHLDVKIDSVISSLVSLFTLVTGKRPKFKVSKPLSVHTQTRESSPSSR